MNSVDCTDKRTRDFSLSFPKIGGLHLRASALNRKSGRNFIRGKEREGRRSRVRQNKKSKIERKIDIGKAEEIFVAEKTHAGKSRNRNGAGHSKSARSHRRADPISRIFHFRTAPSIRSSGRRQFRLARSQAPAPFRNPSLGSVAPVYLSRCPSANTPGKLLQRRCEFHGRHTLFDFVE